MTFIDVQRWTLAAYFLTPLFNSQMFFAMSSLQVKILKTPYRSSFHGQHAPRKYPKEKFDNEMIKSAVTKKTIHQENIATS